jgi:hypothetical protein
VLRIGGLHSHECRGWSRRELLQAGSLGALGLNLADVLRANAHAQDKPPAAKSIILLWLWGGPSHLDTFDLKPKAPVEYRGPYSPINTVVPGIDICELLPRLAARSDQYSIIRSLRGTSNDHGIAGTIGLTGSDAGGASLGGKTQPGTLRPTHGSIVSRVSQARNSLPKFVTVGGHLHQGKKAIAGEGAAGLGTNNDPFRLDYIPGRGIEIPHLQLAEGLSADGLGNREKLLAEFDRISRAVEQSDAMRRLDSQYQQAFSLLTRPETRETFDVEREPDELRRRYGRYRFGQCCLLARRLVESGVRFVQVNWSSHVEPVEDTGDGGWDMHDRYFQQYQDRHAWMLDQSLSALLDDLRDRGLADETVVVAVGEFGRTPKINNKAGRDHWEHCYSGLVAGGGLRMGRVVGASDRLGERPVTPPISTADLFATVLGQIGITTTTLTTNSILPQGTIIEELT